MNWKEATPKQLFEIAFNDKGAPLIYRLEAKLEIERRKKTIVVNHKNKQIVLGAGR